MSTKSSRAAIACRLAAISLLAAGLGGCKPSGDVAVAPTPSPSPATAAYEYGTVITFAKGGESEKYRTFGWSKTEEQFTWTEGQAAAVTMTVPPAGDASVSLRMKLAALTNPPDLPFQPVQVFVNDRQITEWQVSTTNQFTAPLPTEITRNGGPVTITLRLPRAISPKNLGTSEDPRMLGVSSFELELSKSQ